MLAVVVNSREVHWEMTWGWGAGPKISEILKNVGGGGGPRKIRYGALAAVVHPLSLGQSRRKILTFFFGGGDEKALTSTAAVTVFPPFELR